jgi:phosphoribosyl-ATP pyrophosphohydrolase/phosphoribosyl-AMP cyclohydrolase
MTKSALIFPPGAAGDTQLDKQIDWKKLGAPASGEGGAAVPPLVPAIAQDARDGRVLMLGYMSRESLEQTIRDRQLVFYSRSRQRLWKKGETSGRFLDLVSLSVDCDGDAVLARVRPRGPTCHTGAETCFGAEPAGGEGGARFLEHLDALIESRALDAPAASYTAKLFASGLDRIAQKVGEEAIETVIAAKNPDARAFLDEASDLVYHLLVLLRKKGIGLAEVSRHLEARHQQR